MPTIFLYSLTIKILAHQKTEISKKIFFLFSQNRNSLKKGNFRTIENKNLILFIFSKNRNRSIQYNNFLYFPKTEILACFIKKSNVF